MTAPPPGLLLAAPASGSGKTTLTLALLRHLRNAGIAVASVKVGPDYIDPGFHRAASGRPCVNLDGWAMRPETLAGALAAAAEGAELVIGEGGRSDEHTSELPSLMRNSYAVFCFKKTHYTNT